jgi:hypothetical protein
MDMDGDGLVDIAVSGERYYLKNISSKGSIEFSKEDIRVNGGSGDYQVTLTDVQKNAFHGIYYVQRPFRMWKSPYEGDIRILQTAGRVQNPDGMYGRSEIETRTYRGVSEIGGSRIRVPRGSNSESRESVLSVTEGERHYYIHDVIGEAGSGQTLSERNIKGNDISWNIQVTYTRVNPFRKFEELIRYKPAKELSVVTEKEAIKILYEKKTRMVDRHEVPYYELKKNWSGLLIEEVRDQLYSDGRYVPSVIPQGLFDKMRHLRDGNTDDLKLFTNYIYDTGRKEYYLKENISDKELEDVWSLFHIDEKRRILGSFPAEDIQGVAGSYQSSGSKSLSSNRCRGNEGSVYDKGTYIDLGIYAGKSAYVKNGIFYIDGIDSTYRTTVLKNFNNRVVYVDSERDGNVDAVISWMFSDAVEKASRVEKAEMEEIWQDKLFDPLFTDHPRSRYKIDDDYWKRIEESLSGYLFDWHIGKGSISAEEVREFYKSYFVIEGMHKRKSNLSMEKIREANRLLQKAKGSREDKPLLPAGADDISERFWSGGWKKEEVESVFDEAVSANVIMKNEVFDFFANYFDEGKCYVRKTDLKAYERDKAKVLLDRIEEEYFFEKVFSKYYTDEGVFYSLKSEYGGEGDSPEDRCIKQMTEKYHLGKYTKVTKTISYNNNHIYRVENGSYEYVYAESDGTLVMKRSKAKLEWDSALDYSEKNLVEAIGLFDKTETINTGTEAKPVYKPYTYTVSIPNDDILYGGMNNWYYGVWVGDESINPFNEELLYIQNDKVNTYADDMKDKSKEDQKVYIERQGEGLKNSSQKDSQAYYRPHDFGTVRRQYREEARVELPQEEEETGLVLTEGALIGAVSMMSEQHLGWVGEKREIIISSSYYYPYLYKDRIHETAMGEISITSCLGCLAAGAVAGWQPCG